MHLPAHQMCLKLLVDGTTSPLHGQHVPVPQPHTLIAHALLLQRASATVTRSRKWSVTSCTPGMLLPQRISRNNGCSFPLTSPRAGRVCPRRLSMHALVEGSLTRCRPDAG